MTQSELFDTHHTKVARLMPVKNAVISSGGHVEQERAFNLPPELQPKATRRREKGGGCVMM